MFNIDKNGEIFKGDKKTLIRMLKDADVDEIRFHTSVYFCDVYVKSIPIVIRRGDNYCCNKDKWFTYVDDDVGKIGLRYAKKVINNAFLDDNDIIHINRGW